jgi:hypothetical protein
MAVFGVGMAAILHGALTPQQVVLGGGRGMLFLACLRAAELREQGQRQDA